MRRAIEDLEKLVLGDARHSNLNTLHRVLLGFNPPSASMTAPYELFFDNALNKSQIKAIKFALNAPEVACIHGPPGTGKTRVLVEIIRQLVYKPSDDPKRDHEAVSKPTSILVCGASNLAVDNLLERLSVPPSVPISYLPDGTINSSEQTNQKTHSKPLSPILLTRLGHPARVLSSLYNQTLE